MSAKSVFAPQQTNLFEAERIDGIHGTFELAKQEPVHGWYAYLEGYSASFVDSLRARYMPGARRIIDPFAGTGTTPITLACGGLECGYCEVNPVMLHVIHAKVNALRLSRTRRSHVSDRLLHLSDSLPKILKETGAAEDLRAAYGRCFGDSVFFEPDVFDTV